MYLNAACLREREKHIRSIDTGKFAYIESIEFFYYQTYFFFVSRKLFKCLNFVCNHF